jgi:hypothetical protein
LASDHKAIPAIVAFAAVDSYVVRWQGTITLGKELHYAEASVFHQHQRGDAGRNRLGINGASFSSG